jgi:hypothetical protein
MRIVQIHPNHHSGAAEIAGSWPPAWVAYLAGHLREAGFTDIQFIDAMTNHLDGEAICERLTDLKPDIVGYHGHHPIDPCGGGNPQDRIGRCPGRLARARRHSGYVHVQAGFVRGALG